MRRVISVFLCLILAVGLFPLSASAAPAPNGSVKYPSSELDLGSITIDMETGPEPFDPMDAEFDVLQRSVSYLIETGKILCESLPDNDDGTYGGAYYDVDADGNRDVYTYINYGQFYYKVTEETSCIGIHDLSISVAEAKAFEKKYPGKEYYSTVRFIFPANSEYDLGSIGIDLRHGSDSFEAQYGEHEAILRALWYLVDLDKIGYEALPDQDDGTYGGERFDLDLDGNYDVVTYIDYGSFVFEATDQCCLDGDFELSLSKADAKALEAKNSGWKYFSLICFRFPEPTSKDLGTFTFDLSSGPLELDPYEETFRLLDLIADDIIHTVNKDLRYYDYDGDGTADFRIYSEEKSSFIEALDDTNLTDSHTLNPPNWVLHKWRNETMDYYSQYIFVFPAGSEYDLGGVTVDMTDGLDSFEIYYGEHEAILRVLWYLADLDKIGYEALPDQDDGTYGGERFDLDLDGDYDVETYVDYGSFVFEVTKQSFLYGDFELSLSKADAKALEAKNPGSKYYSLICFRFPEAPAKDLGTFIFDLSSGPLELDPYEETFQLLDLIEGEIIHTVNKDLRYYDYDGDGTADFRIYSEGKSSFIEALPGTNLKGPHTLLPPKWLQRQWQINKMDYYSRFIFRFPGNGDPDNPFYDVPKGEYYHDPVLWAVVHDPQITNGTDESHFSPEDTCTRGQVVTFLWRANGKPDYKYPGTCFVDFDGLDYFHDAVYWAKEEGITTGTDETHFSPEDTCTRAQVVTFLWRANGKPEPTISDNPFKDVSADEYYYKAVLWAVSRGITTGTEPDQFSPDQGCTRAQVVTFLWRAAH